MKSNCFSLFFFFFISFNGTAQNEIKEILRGRLQADSLDVEGVTVFNRSRNIGAITDKDGEFFIRAKVTDTLLFKGLSFVSKEYVLTKNDFEVALLVILLDVKINELNEVIVSPNSLTGDLEVDTKKIKTYGDEFYKVNVLEKKQYTDSRFDKGHKITTSPDHFNSVGSAVNFLAIGKGLLEVTGLLGKKKDRNKEKVLEERQLKNIQTKSFADHMKDRFSYHFFTTTLELKEEEIVAFLAYSELMPYELLEYLKPEKELELIEYLIKKSDEFKEINKK